MLVIIDQHAADERVRLEQFTQGKRRGQYSVERSWMVVEWVGDCYPCYVTV